MTQILLSVILLCAIGLLCALILVIAHICMSVKEDEKATALRSALPGVNCGACGYSGCDQYAKALSEDKNVKPNLCIPGGDSVSCELSAILGIACVDVEALHARVQCQGCHASTSDKMMHDGVSSCAGANLLYGGKGECVYGCLGYGDCASVCPNDAICLHDGIARVITARCIGCGLCAKTCPKQIISLHSEKETVTVACKNREKGAIAKKHCSKACIACRKCEKTCPSGAITVEDNLARIDNAKCIHCGECVLVCPDGCILLLR